MTWLARKLCDAALQQRSVQVEHDLIAVAGGERDAGAFVEIVAIEMLARLQASGAGLQLRFLFRQFGDPLFERALLGLQVDVRHEALTARDGLRAEIKDRCAQADAECCGTMFRHRTDPKGGGKMSPDP